MNNRVLIRWLMGPSLPHLIVLGLLVLAGWNLYPHVVVAVDNWGAAKPAETLGKFNVALDTVNNPKWGTLHEIDSTLFQTRLTIDAANKVAIHEEHQLGVYDTYAAQLFSDFHTLAGKSGTAIDAVAGTANAATGTLGAATGTLAEGQRTIKAAQPLLAQLTVNGASLQATTDTLNDTLKRQAIGKLLDNAAGISGDFRTIADKATADFIRRVPWWQQPIKKSGQLIDIGAAIARHTP
jgi:hypothetical protein